VDKAQAKILADGFLASLGGNYDKVSETDLPVIEAMLFAVGVDFNKQVVDNLTKSNAISSGDLLDINLPQIYQKGNGFVLEVGYPINSKQQKYYDYVNKGVKGVGGKNAKPKKNSGDYSFKTAYPNKKMALSLLLSLRNSSKQTIAYKPVSKLERKRKKLKKMLTDADSKKALAYAISSNIKKNGLKATYFFDKAIKTIFTKDFQAAMAEALKADVTIQIRKAWQ
jgi:hypothetical protein